MTPPRGEKMTREWVKAALDDPWGSPVANDVVALLCRKIDKRIDQARKEGFEQARDMAAKEVVDYRRDGKYETGHGFMTDLDEIALKISAIQPPRL